MLCSHAAGSSLTATATSSPDSDKVDPDTLDPDTLVGIRRALCSGSEANPSCDDSEMTCTINDDHHGWCLP